MHLKERRIKSQKARTRLLALPFSSYVTSRKNLISPLLASVSSPVKWGYGQMRECECKCFVNSGDLVSVRTMVSDPSRSSTTLHQHSIQGCPPAGAVFIPARDSVWPSICSWLSVSCISWALSILSPRCPAQTSAQQGLRKCWLNHSELGCRPPASACPTGPSGQACRVAGAVSPSTGGAGFRSGEKLSGTSTLMTQGLFF